MQEQNFENRVRHKLDGLLLNPSPPVWEEVERELGKKKQRRRFFFFTILLVPACIGAALYLSGKLDGNVAGGAKERRESIVNVSPNTTDRPTTKFPVRTHAAPQPSGHMGSNAQAPGTEPDNLSAKAIKKEHYTTGMRRSKPGPAAIKQPTMLATPAVGDLSENTPAFSSPAGNEVVHSVDIYPSSRVKVDSVAARKPEPAIQRSPSPFTPSFEHLSHGGSPTVHRRWQWNIHIAAGTSRVRSSLFQDVPQVRADFQTGSAAGGIPPNRVPSTVNNGGAYTIGINTRKPVARSLWLVTGLHYRLAQTRVTVGATIARDTTLRSNSNSFLSVSAYYNTGVAQELTNNYHFLEVPVGLEWQPLKYLPLTLHTSITGARMIAADAVVFGAQNRMYFKEKKAYHNTQFYLGTAVDYRLIQAKGFSLRAGPYLQYGMTTLEKRGWVDQHLFAAGVKTNISF